MNRINRYLEALPAIEAEHKRNLLKSEQVEDCLDMVDAYFRGFVNHKSQDLVALIINQNFDRQFFTCSEDHFKDHYLQIAKNISNEYL